MQEVYINLDDSGKLTSKEKVTVYAGLVFLSKTEKDKFITQYKSIVSNIKCKYCKYKENCNHKCPEIKNTNIKPNHKRRVMNYIKKYPVICLIIKNHEIYDYVLKDKSSKGRFIDYCIKRLIKKIIINLIENRLIDPYKSIKLIINIDEQSTKSNGYYNLKDSLYEEFIHGITNYDYFNRIKPIIFSELDIKLSYQDSSKSYVVQAADLLAGTIRRKAINNYDNIDNSLNNLVTFSIIFPEKEKSHIVTLPS